MKGREGRRLGGAAQADAMPRLLLAFLGLALLVIAPFLIWGGDMEAALPLSLGALVPPALWFLLRPVFRRLAP